MGKQVRMFTLKSLGDTPNEVDIFVKALNAAHSSIDAELDLQILEITAKLRRPDASAGDLGRAAQIFAELPADTRQRTLELAARMASQARNQA